MSSVSKEARMIWKIVEDTPVGPERARARGGWATSYAEKLLGLCESLEKVLTDGRERNEEKGITKLTLRLHGAARARLDGLVEKLDAPSYTAVVRKALAAIDSIADHEASGGIVVYRYPEDEERADERIRFF